jgi:itaconate CoA-transferase
VQNEREWLRLCTQVLECPQLATDPRYTSNADRVAHRSELVVDVEAALAALSAEQVLARLDDAQIANGRFNTVLDLLDHPQLEQSGRWTEVDTPGGPIRALRPPARIAGVDPVMGPIPAVGEHTASVLGELGYDDATIADWRDRGTA